MPSFFPRPRGSRHRGRGHRSSRRNDWAPLFLLFSQLQQFGFDKIPPVTLLFVALNVAVHLLIVTQLSAPQMDALIHDGCLNPFKVVYSGEWYRLIVSQFIHADNWHLYYNTISLLYKGSQLETRRAVAGRSAQRRRQQENNGGSDRLLAIIVLSVLCNGLLFTALTFASDKWMSGALQFDTSAQLSMRQCAVGFSAVLFTLKTVLNSGSEQYAHYFGWRVPAKHLCWFELVFASLLGGGHSVSFTGHLCGILIGVLVNWRLFDPFISLIQTIGFVDKTRLLFTHLLATANQRLR